MNSMDICQVVNCLNDNLDRMFTLASYIMAKKDVLQNV